MITAKINLAQLNHAVQMKKGKNGDVECIILPIEANNLFKGKDGNIYLDLIAFDIKEPKYDDTHIIKQSLPKEVRDKQSEEEQKAMPILGNLNANFGGGGAAVPNNAAGPDVTLSEEDDLPF